MSSRFALQDTLARAAFESRPFERLWIDLLALLLYLRPEFPAGGSEDGESLHAVLHGVGASKKLS
jgi:hypothetical protein